MMIDDDILPELPILAQCNALSRRHPIVSAQPIYFPDHSIIGHIERSFGLRKSVFVSGAFLAMHTNIRHRIFPNIYNEDWLYFCKALTSLPIFSVGSVKQRPYDAYALPSLACFQELGEIIAEGLFLAKEDGRFSDVLRPSYWEEYSLARKEHLLDLKHLCASSYKDRRMPRAIDFALSAHEKIDNESITFFLENFFYGPAFK